MGKMKIFVYVCAVLFIFLNVSKSDGKESPVNIIVILDTSNRVSEEKHSGQVERDKEIVRSIVDLFDQLVSNHFAKLTMSDPIEYPHSLAFVVPEQPRVPSIPEHIRNKLTIRDQGGGKDPFIEQIEVLRKGIDELYAFVQEQNKFTGADIYKWFDDYAKYYLLDGDHNCIICLSDGYLNFDRDIEAARPPGTYMQVERLRGLRNWKEKFQGLTPIDENFNAKFLMVEIALHRKDSGVEYAEDFDIIKRYWETWLNSMGITETEFIKKGLNTDILKTQIESFITP